MTDKPSTPDKPEPTTLDHGDPSDTLIVPPPTFRERLLAAQKARATGARSTVEIPLPAQSNPPLPSSTLPEVPAEPATRPPTETI